MDRNGKLLAAVSGSPMFQAYARAYVDITGMPLALRPVTSWQLPFRGHRRENGWCALMSGKSATCAACLQTQEALAASARDATATVTCAYGLCETAVPVRLGSETIGFLQTGQILRQEARPASFGRAVERARELGVDLDKARARAAFYATPVVLQKKLDAASSLLSTFSDHLSLTTNQIAVQSANAEIPLITKAKEFIREHHMDDLSLALVSGVAHTSTFYFCKLFRKSTGTTFTEFVSRTRVEKAMNLLLNPNLRVSEIAYEVGFQSLTHFNRAFKRVAGESPSGYRSHLPH